MKTMKKLLALATLLGLSCTMLAGCGGTAATTTSATSATTAAATDATAAAETSAAATETGTETSISTDGIKLVTDGTLTMGTNVAFPPYEYYEDDKVVGIDAEIAAAVADKLGLKLDIEDMEFNSLITAVQTGKIDLTFAGMTVTEDRKKNVDFSDTYATGVQAIIVKEDSGIASSDDLKGKKIGVQESTTGDIYATDDFGEDNIDRYSKGADAVQALLTGKVDAVIIDNEPAKSYVSENEGLKILDAPYTQEDYAAAISKDNPALTTAVNAALAELKADGTLQSIIDKYIPAE